MLEGPLGEVWRVLCPGGRACLVLENELSLVGPGWPRLGMPVWPRARSALLSAGFRRSETYGLFPYLGRNQALVPLEGRGPVWFFLKYLVSPAVTWRRSALLRLLMWCGGKYLIAPWYLVIGEKPDRVHQ